MKVIFVTKFASNTSERLGLISIGCVSHSAKTFYAEPTVTWDENWCSSELSLLRGGKYAVTVSELAMRLKGWIEGFDEQVTLCSNASTLDWPSIKEIFDYHGWPENLNRECGAICIENETQQSLFNRALEDFWSLPTNAPWRHNAVITAQSLMFASWHANVGTMSEAEFQELISTLSCWSIQDGDRGCIYWMNVMATLKGLRKLPILVPEGLREWLDAPVVGKDLIG